MHTVEVKLIADQEILFKGKNINIHDIKTIILNNKSEIEEIAVKTIELCCIECGNADIMLYTFPIENKFFCFNCKKVCDKAGKNVIL